MLQKVENGDKLMPSSVFFFPKHKDIQKNTIGKVAYLGV